ncbi:MAG TPA: ankyrin repeat domain-containing protein, partial [Vicinamibacterales bacterium]|nr:ankyrin repeat domain-containing protein [Vicinamibacterales bacterium]
MRRTLTTVLSIGAMVALSLSTLTHAAPAGAAAFVDAAMNGNRDAVRAFLKDGVDVNTTQADGMTALHWAAQKGDVELATVLIYASANLKATTRIGGYTPLLIRLQCHEGIDASQALYDWDFPRQLLHLRALEATASIQGSAVRDGTARGGDLDVDAVEASLYDPKVLIARPVLRALRTSPSVLLIDEVDRADDEFEAFLL